MIAFGIAVYLVLIGLVLILVEIYAVIAYIFEARAMYTMAARRNIARPWLSFIPVANSWILGKIADDYEKRANGAETRHARKLVTFKIILLAVLVLFFIALSVLSSVAINAAINGEAAGSLFGGEYSDYAIMILLSIIPVLAACLYEIFSFIALYKTYRSCCPSRTPLYFTLSVLFGIAPFLMFSVRERTEGLPAEE